MPQIGIHFIFFYLENYEQKVVKDITLTTSISTIAAWQADDTAIATL
jgi:hypothetical protein